MVGLAFIGEILSASRESDLDEATVSGTPSISVTDIGEPNSNAFDGVATWEDMNRVGSGESKMCLVAESLSSDSINELDDDADDFSRVRLILGADASSTQSS